MKSAVTGHITFELNCGYHPQTSYKEDVDLQSQLKSTDKLATKLRELITICKKNF